MQDCKISQCICSWKCHSKSKDYAQVHIWHLTWCRIIHVQNSPVFGACCISKQSSSTSNSAPHNQ